MLTNYGLEKVLGFSQLEEGESISAQFHLVLLFAVRGIKLAEDSGIITHNYGNGGESSEAYTIALGNDPIGLVRAVLRDDLIVAQVSFKEEKGDAPPYIAFHTGPTDILTATSGHYKRGEPGLLTHDMFPTARAELERREREVLQP